MLLRTIHQMLLMEVKTRTDASLQVELAEMSEELVIIDYKHLPYTFRLVGHSNQVIIVEQIAKGSDVKASQAGKGFNILYKMPAMNYENMAELHQNLETALEWAKFPDKQIQAAIQDNQDKIDAAKMRQQVTEP